MVAPNFDLDTEGVKPEGGIVRRRILRELLRFADELAAKLLGETLGGFNLCPGLDHECDVLESCAMR